MQPKEYKIEPLVEKELEHLITLLTNKEEIITYQQAEQNVEGSQWIQDTIEKIKNKQRDLVNFEYYEKPEAYRKTLLELEELNKKIDENITVQHYRTSLFEANEVVQFVFERLQEQIDAMIID